MQTITDMYTAAKQQPTPAEQFISELTRVTGVSRLTAWRWMSGRAKPSLQAMIMMSNYYGIPQDKLFPPGHFDKTTSNTQTQPQ